jgi:hypothetical protein
MNAHLFIGSTNNKDGNNLHHGRRRQRRRPGISIPELHNLAIPPGTISHEHNSTSANAYGHLVDDDGKWVIRDDVFVTYERKLNDGMRSGPYDDCEPLARTLNSENVMGNKAGGRQSGDCQCGMMELQNAGY